MKRIIIVAFSILAFGTVLRAQQAPDTGFVYKNSHPAYASGLGPLILIDEAHYNFHTRSGGFLPFARLLEQDGYQVKGSSMWIANPAVLGNCRILVIANALDSSNVDRWTLPTPSALNPSEIESIRKWVYDGGSLLLIADHMPFAGAANDLAKAFGFGFLNGFAFTTDNTWPPSVFTRKDGTLKEAPVISGKYPGDRIDSVVTFTGSAFRVPDSAIPVLSFTRANWSLQPDTAWSFHPGTARSDLNGYYQGALLKYGKGRVAVFGEAAMFTAQVVRGTMKVGINSESAPQNARFALNLIHWLEGK